MRKSISKLILAVMALALAGTVAVMSSYAWMILSKSPVAEGIQITIGGGNTILIAPNVTETVDGVTYRYPGAFHERLNFSQADSYAYLQNIGGLSPVSTANGLDWFISGPGGYTLDDTLDRANLPKETGDLDNGHYIYLDFWVVSPGQDYTLRVSSDGGTGSFAIDLPQPVQNNAGGYNLAFDAKGSAATSLRVGFLTDSALIADESILYYLRSANGDNRYSRLKGAFAHDRQGYRFYIYEPNGNHHPDGELAREGSYVITKPLGLVDSQAVPVDIGDRLSVQLQNRWIKTLTGRYQLEERFQTAIAARDLSDHSIVQIRDLFYRDYLQQQVAPYVEAAKFVKSTELLYRAATGGVVEAETLSQLMWAGATEDAYIIKLEKNVPQRIRMFVWLEGQDVDCASSAFADSLVLSLELAGGTK